MGRNNFKWGEVYHLMDGCGNGDSARPQRHMDARLGSRENEFRIDSPASSMS